MKNLSKKTKSFIIMTLIAIILVFILVFIFIISNQKWELDGNIVKKGNKKYEIGDYYEYDETIDNRLADVIDVKWKVLGVDDDGNLLILSASVVEELSLGSKKDLEKSQNDYLTGTAQMNEIAKKYGKGSGAIYSRTISNDDINKLTGYKNEKEFDEITFYWSNIDNLVSKNTKDQLVVSTLKHNNMFYWVEKDKWQINEKSEFESENNLKLIGTFKSNLINYDNQKYEEQTFYIKENNKIFNMLYLEDNNKRAIYWTSTNYTSATKNYVAYGYNAVKFDTLNYDHLVYSSGDTKEVTRGVRVIVAVK